MYRLPTFFFAEESASLRFLARQPHDLSCDQRVWDDAQQAGMRIRLSKCIACHDSNSRLACCSEEVYPTLSDKPDLRLYRLLHRQLRQSPSPLFRCHCTVLASIADTCSDGYKTSASLLRTPMTLAVVLLQSAAAA